MKRYLLTDFNTSRWEGIDIESVQAQFDILNEKITKIGCMYGEIGNPESLEITLNKASHFIKNIDFENNKIYGDVGFLNNDNGEKADDLINNMNFRFGIRSAGICNNDRFVVSKIFTWDIITNVDTTSLVFVDSYPI